MKKHREPKKRQKLKNETNSRVYRLVWKERDPYWDELINWYPKIKTSKYLFSYKWRQFKKWRKKKITRYQYREYRTWKYNRQTQYKQ